MSMYDDVIEKGSNGMTRFPTIKNLSEKTAREIIELIYLDTKLNLDYKVREDEYLAYGKIRAVKKRKSPNKSWSWFEDEIILLNPLEDTQAIADLTGRSFMGIRHQIADVKLKYTRWVAENPKKCDGLSLKEKVELYKINGYITRRGDV